MGPCMGLKEGRGDPETHKPVHDFEGGFMRPIKCMDEHMNLREGEGNFKTSLNRL